MRRALLPSCGRNGRERVRTAVERLQWVRCTSKGRRVPYFDVAIAALGHNACVIEHVYPQHSGARVGRQRRTRTARLQVPEARDAITRGREELVVIEKAKRVDGGIVAAQNAKRFWRWALHHFARLL